MQSLTPFSSVLSKRGSGVQEHQIYCLGRGWWLVEIACAIESCDPWRFVWSVSVFPSFCRALFLPRPGQDQEAVAALLPGHGRADLRGGQLGPRTHPGRKGRVAEDVGRTRDGECGAAGACQQARLAECHASSGGDGKAGVAEAAAQAVVHPVHLCANRRWSLRGPGLAVPHFVLPQVKGGAWRA